MALRKFQTVLVSLLGATLFTAGTVSCTPAEPDAVSAAESRPQHELIVGKWKAAPPANQDAFVDFSKDGLYLASDGCNQTGGGWALDTSGCLVLSGGVSTQIGCNNEPIPDYILSSRQTTVDGDTLTLIDRDGTHRELHRYGDSEITIAGTWVGSQSETIGAEVTFSPDGTWVGSINCFEYRGSWDLRFQTEDSTLDITDDRGQPGEFFVPEDSPSLTTGSEPFTLEQTCTQPGPSVAPDFPVWNGTTYQVYISSDHLNLVVISPPLPGLRSLVFERRPNEA